MTIYGPAVNIVQSVRFFLQTRGGPPGSHPALPRGSFRSQECARTFARRFLPPCFVRSFVRRSLGEVLLGPAKYKSRVHPARMS
jgi:hypothetical protein